MEFPFSLSNLFGDDLSLVDARLLPYNRSPASVRQYMGELGRVLDTMGAASAKAQGLHNIITTAERLRTSDHVVYIKCDPTANSGKGVVIGFLKIGCKKLFTFDRHGVHHEVEPLCILDFYVHESCQRQGAGKQIFDAMLQRENVHPQHLAIDRPSTKLIAFMAKHYGLKAAIPQVNNFVVYEGFFNHKHPNKKPAPLSLPIPSAYSQDEPLLRRDIGKDFRPLGESLKSSDNGTTLAPQTLHCNNRLQRLGERGDVGKNEAVNQRQVSCDAGRIPCEKDLAKLSLSSYSIQSVNSHDTSNKSDRNLSAGSVTRTAPQSGSLPLRQASTAERIFGVCSSANASPSSYGSRNQRTNRS